MVDFGRLEERLNSDPKLRESFLADPVAVLALEGVKLSVSQANALRTTVARMGASQPTVPFINNYRAAPKPGRQYGWQILPSSSSMDDIDSSTAFSRTGLRKPHVPSYGLGYVTTGWLTLLGDAYAAL